MQGLKQSTAINYPVFVHDSAGDPVLGLTNASFVKTISKNGAAFGAMTVTITEMEKGWYSVPISASHTDTLGMLSITFTNPGAKQVNLQWRVSLNIPDDLAVASVNTEARMSELDAGTGGKMANQVDVIEGDTTSLNDTKIPDTLSLANINAEVDAALVDARLDEIAAATAGAVDPVIGSFMDQVLNKDGSQTFSQATDSLEAVADSIPAAAPTAVANAIAVWDRLLTGGTHNIADSAGRRLRDLQEFGVYEGGAIWIDTINGTPGTTDFESGTVFNPVDTMADANTLAASLSLSRFQIAPGSTITLTQAQNNQVFIGSNWIMNLGGQDIAGTEINGAQVTGVAAGVGTLQLFIECHMNAVSHIKNTRILQCAIAGTQTVTEAGEYFFDRCHSGIAGMATWTFDFGALVGTTDLNVRAYSGGITLESMGDTGTDTASIEGDGQIIEGTCAGGNVSVRGNFTISGRTNITFMEDARFDVDQISAAVLDAPKASHVAAGSMGEEIQSHALSTEITALENLSLADIFTRVMDGALTFEEFQNIMYAGLAGKSAGGGSPTLTFRDVADGKDRITATVDGNGNRTAVTVDGS